MNGMVEPGVSLAECTTLRLGGPAARFVRGERSRDIVDVVRAADAADEPLLVLGAGSNVVVGDAGFDGTVLRVANTGQGCDRLGDGQVQLTVEAGADWDQTVAWTVARGSRRSRMPVRHPRVWSARRRCRTSAPTAWRSRTRWCRSTCSTGAAARCARSRPKGSGWRYRTSVLKGTDSAVVLRARFGLRDGGESAPIRYAELARLLGVSVGARVPAADARAAVLDLRRGKGMVLDAADHDTWSAGSFFTNPVIDDAELPGVRSRAETVLGAGRDHAELAGRDRPDQVVGRVADRAGGLPARLSRGLAGGSGCPSRHTLALTNRGGASTEDLLALAREVCGGVRARFGVELRPEPVFVNCGL